MDPRALQAHGRAGLAGRVHVQGTPRPESPEAGVVEVSQGGRCEVSNVVSNVVSTVGSWWFLVVMVFVFVVGICFGVRLDHLSAAKAGSGVYVCSPDTGDTRFCWVVGTNIVEWR